MKNITILIFAILLYSSETISAQCIECGKSPAGYPVGGGQCGPFGSPNCDDMFTTTPTITIPDDLTTECTEDVSNIDTGVATGSGGAGGVTITQSSVEEPGDCPNSKVITKTWVATDACDNTATGVQTITVNDNIPPIIIYPADVTLECNDPCDPPNTGFATATDNCSPEPVISFNDASTQTDFGCGHNQYTITRTWTAIDACGNVSAALQIINVVDNDPPIVACPLDITLACFENLPGPIDNLTDFVAQGGAVSDNCTTSLSDFSISSTTVSSGGMDCIVDPLVYTRTYTIQDACGNSTSCDQVFTLQENTQGPVITSVPPTCYKYCGSLINPQEADINYTSDCASGATVSISGPQIIGPPNCPETKYRFTYTVTDNCGGVPAQVTRDFIIGNNGPTISCPSYNLILECGDPNNEMYIATHLSQVSANSSCGLGVAVKNDFTGLNFSFCNGSTKVVTFTATDDCNRTATCSTTVTILDNNAPALTSTYIDGVCNEAICGSDVSFWFNAWMDKVEENLSATDACPGSGLSWSTVPSNPSANQDCSGNTAETMVTWIAADNCGNSSQISYSFFVTPVVNNNISGMIQTEIAEAVQDVELNLEGGASFYEMFVTGNDGVYHFDELSPDQNYQITPLLDDNPLNGVSSFDLVLMTKHILEMNQLDSPYKMIAADINRSGSISTLDVLELRKMILHINTVFPDNTSWRFVEADFVFPYPNNPFATAFPEVVDINDLLENEQHDFLAVKTGDVNGSAVPNNLAGADDRSFNDNLYFHVDDKLIKAGETYEVVFRSGDFVQISGYQYTLNFDTDLMEFVDISAGDLPGMSESNFGLSLLGSGAITTSWTNNNPTTVKENVGLFRITFKAKQQTQLSEALYVSSHFTTAEAYNVNTKNGQYNLLNVDLRFEGLLNDKRPFVLMQNKPNPFSERTIIGFILPEATSATLTIYEVSGKQLKQITRSYEAGYNEVTLDSREFNTGVLYYQLVTSGHKATNKMLRQY